jgi:hypothetical protein
MLIFAHPDDVEAATMTAWRAGVQCRTGGPEPNYDFIPSALMRAWIYHNNITGETSVSRSFTFLSTLQCSHLAKSGEPYGTVSGHVFPQV